MWIDERPLAFGRDCDGVVRRKRRSGAGGVGGQGGGVPTGHIHGQYDVDFDDGGEAA